MHIFCKPCLCQFFTGICVIFIYLFYFLFLLFSAVIRGKPGLRWNLRDLVPPLARPTWTVHFITSEWSLFIFQWAFLWKTERRQSYMIIYMLWTFKFLHIDIIFINNVVYLHKVHHKFRNIKSVLHPKMSGLMQSNREIIIIKRYNNVDVSY